MLDKTLPGAGTNLNALDGYFNLNDVNAKFLDRSANLNDQNRDLNGEFMAQIYFANLNDSPVKLNDKSAKLTGKTYIIIIFSLLFSTPARKSFPGACYKAMKLM